MDEKEYMEKLQRVGMKLKGLRYTIRGCLGFGAPLRDKLFEKQGQVIGQLQQRRQQNQQNPSGVPPPSGRQQPQIMERFSNRPRFLDFLQPQESQQPELDPITMEAIDEKKRQLVEEAELRREREAEIEEARKKAESLKRAREKMSVENL